jgi:chromate reductase
MKKIGIITGSLRKNSYSRLVGEYVKSVLSQNCEIIEIENLPFYNEDLDQSDPPREWVAFRQKIMTLDGVIFVTPEYNRGIPAVLKNAIDVGSRPHGSGVWVGKPCGVISVTPGFLGAMAASFQLRQVAVCCGIAMMPNEMFIGGVTDPLDERVKTAIAGYAQSFNNWLTKF